MITIDFETRSACDLTLAGADKYAKDPTTEVMCLAYKVGASPTRLWHPAFVESGVLGSKPPHDLIKAIKEGELVEAHNAGFEYAVWHHTLCRLFPFFPKIPDNNWRCSAAKASNYTLPRSLDGAVKARRLNIEKDMEGNRLMRKMCKPKNMSVKELKEYTRGFLEPPETLVYHETREDLKKLFVYCKRDVEAEHALSSSLRDLNPKELAYWQMDQRMNRRGVFGDKALILKAIKVAAVAVDMLNSELQDITDGAVPSASSRNKLKAYCKAEGLELENTRAPYIAELLGLDELPGNTRRVLEICAEGNKTSVTKYTRMLGQLGPDNRIRDTQLYYGASRTGRWSGKGVQPHNYARGFSSNEAIAEAADDLLKYTPMQLTLLYDGLMTFLSKLTRGALCAAPGRKLAVADFSAIEARVLLWLVGDERGLDIFRNGEDIYKDMASGIFKVALADVDKDQRQVGKQAILGLGYSMGAETFDDTCLRNAGIKRERKFFAEVVKVYRKEKFPKVSEYWGQVEAAAIQALLNKGKAIKCKRVTFIFKGRILYCKLPSGRCLVYYEPVLRKRLVWYFEALNEKTNKIGRIMVSTKEGATKAYATRRAKATGANVNKVLTGKEPERTEKLSISFMNEDKGKWVRNETYGGKLVENITQATARDLLAEAMLRVDSDPRYDVLMAVHDEIITEVDPDVNLKEFEDLMAEVPVWAKGCPLGAEGWVGDRYRKD